MTFLTFLFDHICFVFSWIVWGDPFREVYVFAACNQKHAFMRVSCQSVKLAAGKPATKSHLNGLTADFLKRSRRKSYVFAIVSDGSTACI